MKTLNSSFVAYTLQRAIISKNLQQGFDLQDIKKQKKFKLIENVVNKFIPENSNIRIDTKHVKPFELRDIIQEQFKPVLIVKASPL